MVEDGDNTYGGKYVVNPSGGLISKGHPLGATGLAQCAELNWQVRRRPIPHACCVCAGVHNAKAEECTTARIPSRNIEI